MSNQALTKIKPVFKCQPEFKAKFSESTCLLTISVGQEVHEDEKFSTTIELIDNTFKKIVILVDDCLQRHSMCLLSNQKSEALYQTSLDEGDRWLERNFKFYSQLSTPYSILRWEKWLKHPQYPEIYNKINWYYHNDELFKVSFDSTVREFLERFLKRTPLNATKTYEDAFAICLEYLKEECSAFCLWIEGGYHFEVYPSKRNAAMRITHEKLVLPHHPDLLHPVSIKFKNRKQLKPQAFCSTFESVKSILGFGEKESVNVG